MAPTTSRKQATFFLPSDGSHPHSLRSPLSFYPALAKAKKGEGEVYRVDLVTGTCICATDTFDEDGELIWKACDCPDEIKAVIA